MKTKELTTKAVGLFMFFGLFTGREREELRGLQRRVDALVAQLGALEAKLSTTSNATLSVQLNELAEALITLQRSNRKEFGKLWKRDPNPANEIAVPQLTREPCENWANAQREGPGSPAALCQCADCTERRARRDAARAQLVPKTPTERKNAIEKGRH